VFDDTGCTAAGAIPACVAKGAETKTVKKVFFAMDLAMDTSWISPSTCNDAKTSIATTVCGKEYMDCEASGVTLKVTRLSVGGQDSCAARRARQLASHEQAAGALKVDFEAQAKAGAAVDAAAALDKVVAAVQKIETMDTTEMAAFSTALSTDLTANVGVEIKVEGVVVTESARKVDTVEVVAAKPKPAAGGGLGGGAIAGIVIGVLVVLGGGFFLMKKGGGGGSDQA